MKSRLRVLFVCALNQWRSPTAENLYRNHPSLEVRSAGIRHGAKPHLSPQDIRWADVIFVMDQEQKIWIRKHFPTEKIPQILILDIPGNLTYMDPELQDLLRLAIDPEINALLGK